MKDFAPKVKTIANKVSQVLDKHFELQNEFDGLKVEHQNLKNLLGEREATIQNLNDKLKQMQLESESGTLNEAVKAQLNNYIAEIESCLTLLKQ